MPRTSQLLVVWMLAAAMLAQCGCNSDWNRWGRWDQPQDPPEVAPPDEPFDGSTIDAPPRVTAEIPHPINLLLPKRIDIHPFTRARPVDASNPSSGILDVRIQLLDSFDDPVKGFGAFRFTLFRYRITGADRRGEQLVVWDEDLSRPSRNLTHWDPISNAYKFNLKWSNAFADGQRYVLEAYFVSPYTDQLFDTHAIVVGQ